MVMSSSAEALDSFASGATSGTRMAPAGGAFPLTTTAKKTKRTTPLQGSGGS